MSVSNSFRELARFLDECEAGERVEDVELTDRIGTDDRTLHAVVELSVTTCPSSTEDRQLSLASTTIDDGTLECTFRSPEPVVPTSNAAVEVETSNARFEGDGTVTVTLSVQVRIDDGTVADGGEPSDSGMSNGNPDVPPFQNPERLAEVYESCDTFAEMTDALDMDVTAETVRRYMIDFDIHEPNSYATGDDEGETDYDGTETGATDERVPGSVDRSSTHAGGDEQSQVILPDGIGLPEDITADSLVETVKQSNTVYEFKRDIGLDREEASAMLRELNLLDLLLGRVATEAERDITREEIIDRLREASGQQ